MFKKSLLLMLLMAFMAPWAAMGQLTATFNEGTATNAYVPIYGLYADYGCKSQFIIPAADLAAKGITSNCEISKLKFYSNATTSATYFGTSCIVEVGEVDYTTFSSSEFETSGLTTKLEANTLTRSSDGTVEVSFSSNYTYNGGNLLISIGGYGNNAPSTSFNGVSSSGAGVYGYNSSNSQSIPSSGNEVSNFAPKTTITYSPTTPYITLSPSSATLFVGGIQTLTATTGNAGTPSITFYSDNTSVATVSGSGTTATVTAVAVGTATITAAMTYGGTEYTATSTINVEEPSYCTPNFNYSSYYIKDFTTTKGDNNINNTGTEWGTNGYSNYYGSHYVSAEQSTTSKTINFTVKSSKKGGAFVIWVDWDKNYVFNNTDEKVASVTAGSSSYSATGSFIIPANTEPGDYRIRVEHVNYSSYADPCIDGNYYGEVEDYKLTVTAPVLCKVPTGLAASDITVHTASLSWTVNNEETAWKLYWKNADDDDYTEVATGVTNPYTLEGLDGETTYDFYVVANCDENGFSDPSEVFSFTTEEACPKPTNFTASSVGTTITASWSGTADSYDVYYSTESTLPASVMPQYTAIEGTSQEITGLSVGTYYVWVRANCDGEDPSAWVGPASAYVGYCTPAPTSVDGDGITNVTFGTGSNIVNNDTPTATYSDYSSLIGAVEAGTELPIAITFSTGYVYNTYVWVDFDNSLTFDADEVICYGECTAATPNTLTLNYSIPVTQALGDFRMRIGSAYKSSWGGLGSDPTTANACYSSSDACFQDYTLRVLAGNPCTLLPANFGIEPAHTSATVTWETTDGVSCDIYYSNQNTAPTNGVTLPDAQAGIIGTENSYSYTINGLTANTPYYVWVRVNCEETLHGNWASAGSFTTLDYDAPTGLSFSTTYNSATASWTAPHNNIVSYTYQYEAEGIAMVEGTTENNTPTVNLTGLTQSTTYTFRVKANYPGNHSSEFAESTFNTPAQYPAPTGLVTSNIKTTSVTLAWNEATGATGYNLRYRTTMGGTEQVGDDITLAKQGWETYNFDLSGFSGTGRLAIRHYNCSDMLFLAIDEVTVKNSSDQNVLSESFESSTLPEGWNTIDEDGDGKNWVADETGYAKSYSYQGGKLYPDNWLITPEVQLGGSMTVIAGAGSGDYFAETFGIYVLTSGVWMEVNGLTESTYTINNLDAQTGYDVQVKAVYGENASDWSEVYNFTTLPLKRYTSSSSWYTWSSSSAWTPSGVPTENHDVVIEQNATIGSSTIAQANNITVADGKTLTLEDGGQLICNNAPTVTVQKNITVPYGFNWEENKDGWYFIASPITSEYTPAGDMIENQYDLYQLNPATIMWENYKENTDPEAPNNAAAGFKLVNGRGYLYANSADVTLSFTGAIVPSAATKDVVVAAGWNLIGNPFTYKVYSSVPYYAMNAAGTGITAETVSTSTAVNPCTGIVVEAAEAGNVAFSKTAPEMSSGNQGNLQMTLAQRVTNTRGNSNMTLDNVIVSFNEGSELHKFYFMQQNANLYIPQGNEEYAIVNAEAQGTMPVNFRANENGQYTLTVNAEDVEMNYLHLIDNMTGADIDLLQTPSYSFNATVMDYESRFKLVFCTGVNDNSDSFAFCSNGNWIINNEGEATLQVIDVTGRILSSETVNGSVSKSINAAPGVYMIRLINGENVKVQKVVIE